MAILEVNHLEKSFGSTQVLKDISFSLEKGQALSIIGSSGSGKTTLLRCLTGLEFPDSGSVCLSGGGSFGLVFQNFNLFPQYTALENVMLAPSLQKKQPKEQLRQEAMDLLSQVGLSDRANNYPWQLSGGQQQRTAIARALALKPEVLCFDEPTSALDPELTGEVLRTIRGLKEKNHTMIVVTHEMEFAKCVADVVIYMADGVIEEMGTPEQIFRNPQSEKTRAFLRGMEDWFQFYIEDAVLPDLDALFPQGVPLRTFSRCVCLSGCTVGDISALERPDVRLSELVILVPHGSNERERWRGIRCGKYTYYEYKPA